MKYSLTVNSVTNPADIYSESRTGSSQNLTILEKYFLPLAVAATVVTSSATIATHSLVCNSSVSTKDTIQVRQNNQKSLSKQEAIAIFAKEWQLKSISLSAEDSKLWEEIIASQSEIGFPDF